MSKLYYLDVIKNDNIVSTPNSRSQIFQYLLRKTPKAIPVIYQFSQRLFSFAGSQEERENLEEFIGIKNALFKNESKTCDFLESFPKFDFPQLIVNLLSVTYLGFSLLEEFGDTIISFDMLSGKLFCEITIKQAVINYAGVNSDPFKFTVNIQWLGNRFLLEKLPTTNLDSEKERLFLSEKDKKEEIEQSLLQNRVSDDKKLIVHTRLLAKFSEIKIFFIEPGAFEEGILAWMGNLENSTTKTILTLPLDSLQLNYAIADTLHGFLTNTKTGQSEENFISEILLILIKQENYSDKIYLFNLFKLEFTNQSKKANLNAFINGLKKYIESNYSCKNLIALFKLHSELSENIFSANFIESMRKLMSELLHAQPYKAIYIELIDLLLNQTKNESEKKYLKDFLDKSNYTSFSDERLIDVLLTIYWDEITANSAKNIDFFKTMYLNAFSLNIDEESQLQEIKIDPVYSDFIFNSTIENKKKLKKIKFGIMGERRALYTHYEKIINADRTINSDKKVNLLSLFRKLILNRDIVFSIITSVEGRSDLNPDDNSKTSLKVSTLNSAPSLSDKIARSREIVSKPESSKDNANLNFNDNQDRVSTAASTPGSEYSELSSGYQSGDSSKLECREDLGSAESLDGNFVSKQGVHIDKVCNTAPPERCGSSISTRSFFSTAIPLPDKASYNREKYLIEAYGVLQRSLSITINSRISPDYNYVPREFFNYLKKTIFSMASSNESKNLLKKFFIKFHAINETFLHILEHCMMQRHSLIEAVDYYNKFYYFERSRGGVSKAFSDEKKITDLGINEIVKNVFLLAFDLFFNATDINNFELLQSTLSNSLKYLSMESSVVRQFANEVESKKSEEYASFIDLDFKEFLTDNFLKIKKEIYFLENNVNTFISLPKNFFSQLKLGIFFGEKLLAKLKKNIYWNQSEGSYEQQTTELIAKLKKLSWFKLFFTGIFFWSIQSKTRVFEKIERCLIASIYKEKLNQITALKTSLEQSLNSLNTEVYNLNENQTIASNFARFVSIVDSLVKYPIPQHLDIPSFVKLEGLTNTERAKLIETVKLFTRPMRLYWENCLLPKQEEKINKNICASERQQNIILKKVEKLTQGLQNAIDLYKKNTTFFSTGYRSGMFSHQAISKPVTEANLSRKFHS